MSKRKQKAMRRAMADVVDFYNYEGNTVIHTEKKSNLLQARNSSQQTYIDVMEQDVKKIVFGVGPAGTGKTYVGVALAVKALKDKEVKRIILTRPAVEAGENLGFLPGDLKEKLDPYMQPLYDSLRDMIPQQKLNSHIENGTIQILSLIHI